MDSFLDGCAEAGEAQGVLNGSNFVATPLQLHGNFVATLSDPACKEAQKSSAALVPNANVLQIYNCYDVVLKGRSPLAVI